MREVFTSVPTTVLRLALFDQCGVKSLLTPYLSDDRPDSCGKYAYGTKTLASTESDQYTPCQAGHFCAHVGLNLLTSEVEGSDDPDLHFSS